MELDDDVAATTQQQSPMIEVIASTTTSDIMEADDMTSNNAAESSKVLEPWEERMLDAQEILSLAKNGNITLRPTTRMHLEGLGKRLQKEGEALQRVAATKKTSTNTTSSSALNISAATSASTNNIATSPVSIMSSIPLSSSVKYVPIDRFAFDAGGYNEPFVTLYIDMADVGTVRDSVTCKFTKSSFDLIIANLHNKSYRLYKDCLEKDIDPDKSKFSVKANKVVIKLAKVKTSEYGGFDYWTKLSDPKKSSKNANGSDTTNKKDDPTASIMDMMKQMYDEGDDNMKKIIGETMMKQRNGELNKDKPGMPDFGKSGIDDMDDF
jgi:calcyclin binding protein